MCRAQGFAQVVSTSYPVSEKLWIEVCVTWEFTCMFSGYSSHLGLHPTPPAWHRKDHKYGRSFSLAIFVLWPSKATVINYEYCNQTCTIQHLFCVSVCNQLCSLQLLRRSVKPLTRERNTSDAFAVLLCLLFLLLCSTSQCSLKSVTAFFCFGRGCRSWTICTACLVVPYFLHSYRKCRYIVLCLSRKYRDILLLLLLSKTV